jgi:hypothetical protein
MQEEISKHTKNIYKAAKTKNHSPGEKVREIIIEIFIIVFAVTLSIWLHGWSEHRKEQKEVKEFMADLKEDLNNDIASMQSAMETLSKNTGNFLFIQQLTKEGVDSLIDNKGSFGFNSSIGTTKISNGNYEGFKSSGKITFIENKTLKKNILKFYQEITPGIIEAEKINSEQVLKITDFWSENADMDIKKKLLNGRFKSMLDIFHNTATSSLKLYEEGINLAKQIIKEIEEDNK